MTANDLFAVGARLLGIYFVAIGMGSLPSLAILDEFARGSSISPTTVYATSILQVLIYITIGLWLIFRYRQKMTMTHSGFLIPQEALAAGVQLFGVYFAISGVISLATKVTQAAYLHSYDATGMRDPTPWLSQLPQFMPPMLYTAVGLFMAFRASQTVAFLPSFATSTPNSESIGLHAQDEV